jgi:hypothetical protein
MSAMGKPPISKARLKGENCSVECLGRLRGLALGRKKSRRLRQKSISNIQPYVI